MEDPKTRSEPSTASAEESPPEESKATPLQVDYTDSQSVISALQDEGTHVDLMELQRPDRTEVLEEVALWVRAQEGMEELKKGLLEASLVANIPEPEGDGLIKVDPDLARSLFDVLREKKAGVASLLYPFLIMLQDENRKGLFQESDLRRRLPEMMGVPPDSITEELNAALMVLHDKDVLIRYDDGEMFLNRHYVEPSREEVLGSARGLPVVEGELDERMEQIKLHPSLAPLKYSGRTDGPLPVPQRPLPWGLRQWAEDAERVDLAEHHEEKPASNDEYTKERLREMLEGENDHSKD